MSEVNDEIGEMLKSLAGIDPIETPKEESKEEQSPAEPSAEVKEEEIEEVEAPAEPPVKDEEPPEQPMAASVEDKDAIIASLRAQLAERTVQEPPKELPKESLPTKPSVEDKDFVKDVDLDDVTRDPAELNKLFNNVYKQAVIDTQTALATQLPNIIREQVTLVDSLRKASEQFYVENKDLDPFKKVVSTVFTELAAKDPNKTYSDVLAETAKEVRKRLELPDRKVVEKPSNLKAVPQLPKKGGKAGSAEVKQSANPLQDELEEMTKTLGR